MSSQLLVAPDAAVELPRSPRTFSRDVSAVPSRTSVSTVRTGGLTLDAELSSILNPSGEPGLPRRRWSWLLPALLFLAAIAASTISLGVDVGELMLIKLRHFCSTVASRNHASSLALEVFMDVLLVCLARCAMEVDWRAKGSGIPEVKCLLSHKNMRGYFSPRIMLAKAFGLMFALGSGLPLGKEGPFVHISACMSFYLLDKPFFKPLQATTLTEAHIVLAAVAVGVGATFSSPVGGVLFAVELMMPHVYDITAYWGSFCASVAGGFIYLFLKMMIGNVGLKPIITSDVPPEVPHSPWSEMLFVALCIAIGVLCGALGGLFVRFHQVLWRIMDTMRLHGQHRICHNLLKAGFKRDLAIIGTVAAVVTLGRSWSPMMMTSQPVLLTELFSVKPPKLDSWSDSAVAQFATFFALKWVMTAVSLCLPVPTGCISPLLVLGGLLGRTIAAGLPSQLHDILAPNASFDPYVARLSLVAGTAFAASVTRTFSIVVSVFELVSVPRLILPLCASALAAIFTANAIAPSLFDSFLMLKRYKCLPLLVSMGKSTQPVSAVMRTDLEHLILHRRTSRIALRAQVDMLLTDESELMVPIVEEFVYPGCTETSWSFAGAISREELSPLQELAGLQESDVIDVWSLAVKHKMAATALKVDLDTSLKDVYLLAQQSMYLKQQTDQLTCFVIEHGTLRGVVTTVELNAAQDPS